MSVVTKCKTEKRKAIVSTDSQWSKHEACFACVTRVRLTPVPVLAKLVRCLKRIAQASDLGSCQSKSVIHEAMNCCKNLKIH